MSTKINNSAEASIKEGKWKNPGASLYNKIMEDYTGDWRDLLEEAYLHVGSDLNNDPHHGRTPYSRSECKYPHHVIRNGELVVSIPGLRAAYSRAKQMGVYKGKVKEHIDRHYKEMGLTVDPEKVIEENFLFIESMLDSGLGTNLVMMESAMEEVDTSTHIEEGDSIEELEMWIESFVHDEEFRETVCADIISFIVGSNDPRDDLKTMNESASEDSDIIKKWFITSDDGVDNCCIQVKGYDKPMRGRSAMITLKLDPEDDHWYVLCKKNTDDYGVPGGGWNKNETPEHAAIRELHEEVLTNVKNVKRMGTLIEYHDTVKDWVKEHVPNEKDWWYGYYSAVFVGIYDGEFKGKVKEEDRESGYDWKKVDYSLLKKFPKEYSDAINTYINTTPLHESIDDSLYIKEADDDPPSIESNNQTDAPDDPSDNPEGDEEINGNATNDDTFGTNVNNSDIHLDNNPNNVIDNGSDSGTPNQEIEPEGSPELGQTEPSEAEEPEPSETEVTPAAPPPKTPISRPKQFARQEEDKNGVRRKNLYIEFIRWAKEYNTKNIFGSNFDKDIFHVTYPFVPDELRYFYRLADPILCILGGGLTFFPVIQLRKVNSQNPDMNRYLIFAATENDLRIFNSEDKRVYFATEQNGRIVLGNVLADTFDIYIQTMIKKGDILNGPREDTTMEYVEDIDDI